MIQMNLFMRQKETHRHRKQSHSDKGGKDDEGRDKSRFWG